ncbi:MAG: hypothetical protein K0U68_08965 [Gammaproteobacteria bacterium]|nr:hypothetical protein [Gammaproteobacteria bacterium]
MTKNHLVKKSYVLKYYSVLLLVLATGFLTACDNTPTGKTSIVAATPKQTYNKVVTVNGVVRGEKGVIKSGEIKVISQNKTVATSTIGKNGRYQVDIPSGTEFPLLISALPADQSQYKKLSVAVVNAMLTNHDITPSSTEIAKTAKKLGGYTKENLFKAALGTVDMPDRDTTAAGFRGDPTKQFGGWH